MAEQRHEAVLTRIDVHAAHDKKTIDEVYNSIGEVKHDIMIHINKSDFTNTELSEAAAELQAIVRDQNAEAANFRSNISDTLAKINHKLDSIHDLSSKVDQ